MTNKAPRTYLRSVQSLVFLFIMLSLSANATDSDKLPTEKIINLELIDADIRAVIKTISDATGKNFLIDPRVKGKITIVSNSALDRESVYEVFLTALRTHGYVAIEQGSVISIMPDTEAKYSSSTKDARTASGNEQITQVVKVHHISVAQLVPVLRPLMSKEAYAQAYAETNIVVLSDSKRNIQRLLSIIENMDQPSRDINEIIPLHHASAADVLAILKETLPKKSDASARITADKRSNSIIVSGERAEQLRYKNLITQLDAPIENNDAHHVVFLEHATAKDLAVILEKLINTEKKDPKASQSSTSIIADESTNSLVISADLENYQSLYKILKQLDVPRLQVMIQAIIAEVSIDMAGKLGVEWGAIGSKSGIASTSKNNGGFLSAASAVANNDLSKALLTGGLTALISKNNIGLVLNAIKNDANVNILSAPNILTLDNKEAEIIIGETVPFITGSFSQSSAQGATNPFQTISRKDIGLILRVKPQINQGGVVNLTVFQEISNVKNTTTAVDLITTKRSINSTVAITDGNMLALGGLMDSTTNDTEDSVPILGDIPILGWLFKTKSTDSIKRTLMVFIKPTIIRTTEDVHAITQKSLIEIKKEQKALDDRFLLINPDKERYNIPQQNNQPDEE